MHSYHGSDVCIDVCTLPQAAKRGWNPPDKVLDCTTFSPAVISRSMSIYPKKLVCPTRLTRPRPYNIFLEVLCRWFTNFVYSSYPSSVMPDSHEI